jgi:hypothetical protein
MFQQGIVGTVKFFKVLVASSHFTIASLDFILIADDRRPLV